MGNDAPMNSLARFLARIAPAAALLAGACVQHETQEARPATAVAAATAFDRDPGFPAEAAADVFNTGFRTIVDKYIDQTSLPELSVEGLRGLSALDPGLAVERSGGFVRLVHDGGKPIALREPGKTDVDGWTNLTVGMIAQARTRSAELGAARAEKIYEAVFDGVLSELDMFSRYAGAVEAKSNRARRDGYVGVGIRFSPRRIGADVIGLIPGSAAEKAGVRPGDIIVRIDGKPLVAVTAQGVSRLLRGPARSNVNIRIRRQGAEELLSFDLVRSHVMLPTVDARREGGVLFLEITGFNQSTAESLAKAYAAARKELGGAFKGMVLDMRGNPGGLLRQSVDVADLFLTQGEIVSTRGRHPESVQHYDADPKQMARNMPIVVLIDGKSASASEIVAAALQDRGRAIVVGTNSFGKGTVQTVAQLPNDGELTLTWSRLMTPAGYSLHGLGVRPTICTSGVVGSGEELLPMRARDRKKTASAMAAWLGADPGSKAGLRRLRATCPSEKRTTDVELAIARRLIEDRALYNSTLSVRASKTAERN